MGSALRRAMFYAELGALYSCRFVLLALRRVLIAEGGVSREVQ